METKICKGILHPEGVELPIDRFPTVFNKNRKNPKIYYLSTCKTCYYYVKNRRPSSIKARKRYQKTHLKEFVKYSRKYQKKQGVIYLKQDKDRKKKYADSLDNYYIKQLLIDMGIHNLTSEIIEIKRNQLKLYRYAKSNIDQAK